jgi:hypothetical protein
MEDAPLYNHKCVEFGSEGSTSLIPKHPGKINLEEGRHSRRRENQKSYKIKS